MGDHRAGRVPYREEATSITLGFVIDNKYVTDVEIANIVGILDFHRELDLAAVCDLLESS
ncbi:MAG: hypothetical protein ABEI86_10265 [Halobacteriaceae archaeon]